MSEAIRQLKAARQWIDILVQEMDIDPAETIVSAKAVSPAGSRTLATISLATSLAEIDAVLATPTPDRARPEE